VRSAVRTFKWENAATRAMAGRDHGRTDDGETAAGGTGFRFDDAADPADRRASTRDDHGTAGGAAAGDGDGSGGDERVRDERARAALNERLSAVERAVTGTDAGPADLSGEAAREQRLDDLADRLDDLESRVADLEGGLQAVRGYVGDIRAVNRDIERRVEAALAAVDDHGADDEGDSPERATERPEHGSATGTTGDERECGWTDRGDTDGSPDPGRRDRCEHCGRPGPVADAAGGRPESTGSATATGAAGRGEPDPDGPRPSGRCSEPEPGDREPGPDDGRTKPAEGMGSDLDARADGYRPPAVTPTDDEDGDGDGPLARLRDAL